MSDARIDFVLDIIEGIICLFGVIIFSIVTVEVNELQRFIFVIADFYCAIKLSNCIDGIIKYIKFKNNNIVDTKQIDQIMYWS